MVAPRGVCVQGYESVKMAKAQVISIRGDAALDDPRVPSSFPVAQPSPT
ncbi:MAG TPA: hypothetical protein PK251_12985 [Candidatus Latescibacteria bacterium]|nr:hypothetical protein [Candidatus Latescibacterota bacterium]HQI76834.1 hypothetical protein [Candidatus Latescibacterota bacterium]